MDNHAPNLDKLFETYSDIVTEEYKSAILDLKNAENVYTAPTIDVSEASIIEAASHVEECSAYYGMVCKIAGLSSSAYALAEGRYKQLYREALGRSEGKNEAAREAFAATETAEYLNDLLFFESASKLFAALERSARVAADSSRKIADLVQSHHITEVGNKY